jgi:hypothetical protein
MPVGFSRSLFGSSATSSGANWSAYTGANDVEYTISDCSGIIGFKEFDSTRGLLVTYQAVGGQPGYDLVHVRLVTLDPSANTLTFGSKISHGISDQSLFTSKRGTIQKTHDDAIVVTTNDNDGTCRTYYLVSGTLTQSNKITTNNFASGGRGAVRRSDNAFNQLLANNIRKVSITNPATASPTSSEDFDSGISGDKLTNQTVPGFDGDDVMLIWMDTGTDLMACKRLAMSPSAPVTPAAVSGLGNVSLDLESSDQDNFVDLAQGGGMNAGYETTAFNDTAILIERGYPSTAPADNTWRFHTYKAGQSVYNSCTVISNNIGGVDPASYAFLGSTNTNCFFITATLTATSPSRVSTYWIIDLNLSTNSARVVESETLNFEIDPRSLPNVFRFGNDRGLYNYSANKLWLMVP